MQKQLLAAFGEECDDLLQAEGRRSETGQTVFAYTKPVELSLDHRAKFSTFALARFDKTGEVLMRFRGKDITAAVSELTNLIGGDDSQVLTLTGPGGLKFVLPGTKPVR
jgi:hypothetical protein